jgi:hypothetical protein
LSDDELLNKLDESIAVDIPPVAPELIEAVRAAALREQARSANEGLLVGSRRSLLVSSAAVVAGAVGGVLATKVVDGRATKSSAGPPTEGLVFAAGAAAVPGAELSGKVINHTWGVELLLDASGLPVGAPFRVVYLSNADTAVDAGGFVGAAIPIHCRCNAALLRDRITAIEIRDAAEKVVSRADFDQ